MPAAVTENVVPGAAGCVTVTGLGVQVEGTVPAQLRVTWLAYPLTAVSVPLNVAVWVGKIVSEGFDTMI